MAWRLGHHRCKGVEERRGSAVPTPIRVPCPVSHLIQVGWPTGEESGHMVHHRFGLNAPRPLTVLTVLGTSPHPEVSSLTDRLGSWSLSGQLGRGQLARRETRDIRRKRRRRDHPGWLCCPEGDRSSPSFTWQDEVGTSSPDSRSGPHQQGAPTPWELCWPQDSGYTGRMHKIDSPWVFSSVCS